MAQLATGTYSIDLDSAVDITITDGITESGEP
jgi:hypothetical protein